MNDDMNIYNKKDYPDWKTSKQVCDLYNISRKSLIDFKKRHKLQDKDIGLVKLILKNNTAGYIWSPETIEMIQKSGLKGIYREKII
jgi:hypothetical protein